MKHYLLPLLSLLALAAAGCKGHPASQPAPVETVPAVAQPVTRYMETDTLYNFHYFTANFTVEAQGIRADGVLRMKRDSLIWLSVNKIVELGRAEFTPDSLFGYLKVGNKFVACSYADLHKRLGIDIDFRALQRILLGKGSNCHVVQVEYDRFDTIGGEELPRQLDLTLNDKRYYTTAKLEYTKIALDQPGTFPFSIPKNATRLWPTQ